MRRLSYISYALALSVLSLLSGACSKEKTATGDSPISFTASRGDITRTYVDDSYICFFWEKGDAISVFDGFGGKRFVASGSGSRVVFTGMANPEAGTWYALYPFYPSAIMDGGAIVTDLPTVQYAAKDNVPEGSLLSVGTSEDGHFDMRNATGLLRFTLSSDWSSVIIRSLADENVTGQVSISMGEDGIPSASVISDISSEVKLLPQKGESVIKKGRYFVSLAPQTLSGGYEALFYGDDASKVKYRKNTSLATVVRSAFRDLGTLDGRVTSDWINVNRTVYTICFRQNSAAVFDNSSAPNWPFEGTAPGSGSKIGECDLVTLDGLYTLHLKCIDCYLNSSKGLQISCDTNGYIDLPAIEGKRLVEVRYVAGGSTGYPYIAKDDGMVVRGGSAFVRMSSHVEYTWNLEGLAKGAKYRFYFGSTSAQINRLQMVYEDLAL